MVATVSAGTKGFFLLPVNFLAYSRAQLRLKAGSRLRREILAKIKV
jgi:hypothetical protein